MYTSVLRFIAGYSRLTPVLQDQQKHNKVLTSLTNDIYKKLQPNNLFKESYKNIPNTQLQHKKNNHFLKYQQCKLLDNRKVIVIHNMSQNKIYQINAIQYQANLSIQDRIVIGTLKSLKAQTVSVFDGHGGDKLSGYCAQHLVQILDGFLEKNKDSGKYIDDQDELISNALKFTYNKLDNDFYQNVYQQLYTLNNKKIKAIGTCALTVVIYNKKIYVSNSGDSQAIAVFKGQDNQINYIELNQRFSANNPKQKQRLKKQFPKDDDIIVQQKSGNFYVKGRLQPTRALGDYHLKFSHLFKGKGDFNGPYIKTEPDIKIFAIKNKFERIVLASDGVWDFLNKNVVAESSFQQNPHQIILQKSLHRVAELHKKSITEIKEISPRNKRSFHDDISIAVVDLTTVNKTITIF